jgi:cytochrome c5
MRHPDKHSFSSLMLITGMLISVAFAQVTLAALADPAATGTAPDSSAKAVAAAMTGQQVYNNVCIACHFPPGVGGAPALGDVVAWAPRIAQGIDSLIDHALNGFTGSTGVMPKKGERLDLSDKEIIRSVEYMVEQVVQ